MENNTVIEWRLGVLESEMKVVESKTSSHETRLGLLEQTVETLVAQGNRIEKKLDSNNNVLRGVLITLILSLLLMLANLVFGTHTPIHAASYRAVTSGPSQV